MYGRQERSKPDFGGEPKVKKQFRRHGYKWENNIKMVLQ